MAIPEALVRRVTEWWGPRGGIAQFHRPTGLPGRLAGWIMAHRASNVARSRWAVDLLDLRPDDRLIEVGCGPGIAIAAAASRIREGAVVGVDHSEVVIRQAARRNRRGIRSGRVRLVVASVEHLPSDEAPFTTALAVNTVGMWPDPATRIRELSALMAPGGRILLVAQPRLERATAESVADDLGGLIAAAGLRVAMVSVLPMDPPAVGVHAEIPAR